MSITNFNAKNGLSVGTGSINVIDNAANATFATAMTTGSLGVGTPTSATSRMFVSGSSVASDTVAVIKAGTSTPSGKLLDIRNNSGTTVTSVDYLGNISANTGSFSGDLSVAGNLTILGSSSVINSTIVSIGDNIVQLNTQSPTQSTGGLWVADTTSGETGSLIWDSTTNRWKGGLTNSEINLVTTGSTDNLYNKTIPITGTPSNNISGGTTGGVGYFDGSTNLKSSVAGTSNQLLQSNGSSAPSWVSPTTVISNNSIITGSGTANYVSKFSSGNAITISNVYDDGTNVGIGTSTVNEKLVVQGNIGVVGEMRLRQAGTSYVTVANTSDVLQLGGQESTGTPNARVKLKSNFVELNATNVGIGTTTTGDLLSVNGTMSVTGSYLNPGVDNSTSLGSATKKWSTVYATAFSGSLTTLANGSSYIVAGTGIGVTSGSSGQVTIALSNTGSAGTYGSATQVPVFVTDAQGRVTSVTNTSIQIAESQVTNLTNDLGNRALTSTTITAGTGLTGGGDLSANRTLSIDNTVVATISGSTFTGAVKFNGGLSGSLTKLSDGVTNYLQAGTNIQLSTGSNGAVTIASTATGASYVAGSNTQVQFNDGGTFGANSGLTYNKTTGALTGTYVVASTGFSGSLTRLTDGTSYIVAGTGIGVSTGSTGQVTVALTNTGSAGTYGSASQIPVFVTDAQGRVTSVTNTSVQIAESQVTSLTTDLANRALTSTTITAGTGLTGGGDLSTNRTISLSNTGSAGTYGSASQVPVIATDAQGRVTSATNTSIQIAESQVTSLTTDLGNRALTSTTITAGNGLKGGGDLSTNRTLSIDDSIVATISGATFTGAVKFNGGLSGSLTTLANGSSYIIAGGNMSVVTGSSGAITLSTINSGTIYGVTAGTGLTGGGTSGVVTLNLSNTGSAGTYGSASQVPVFASDAQGRVTSVTNTSIQIAESQVTSLTTDLGNRALTSTTITAGTGLTGGGDLSTSRTLAINNSVVATISGSTFTGAVKFNAGLSGSLTTLTDGTPYLIAGSNVTLSTGSNGAVTISSASPSGTLTGTGTNNYVSKFTGTNTLGTGVLYDDGTNVGVGTATPLQKLDVAGSVRVTGNFYRPDNVGIAMTLGNGSESHYQDLYVFYNGVGNTEFTRLNSTGLGVGATPSSRLHVSGSSTSSTPVFIAQAGVATPTGKVVDVRNQGGSTVASVDYLGNFSANTGSFSGDLSVAGNLTILGSSSIINSTIVSIGDNIVQLNTQSPTQSTGGLWVADVTSGETGSLIWDSTTNRWKGGLTSAEINLVTTGSTDSLFNKTLAISGLNSNTISGGTQGGVGYFNTSGYLSSSAAGTSGQILQSAGTSSPTWVNFGSLVSGSNVVTGSGTAGYHSKFTSGNALANGVIYDDGTNIGIGTTSASTFAASRSLVIGQSAVTEQNALKIYGGNNADRAPVISLFRAGNSEGVISQIVTNSMLALGSGGGIASFTDSALIAYSTLFIGSAGNVGIGTSNFGSKLYVSGSSTASTPTMTVKEGVASPTGGVGVLDVQNSAGTSILFVTGSGRVGIGTITPQATFHVANGVSPNLSQVYVGYGGSNNYYDANYHFFRNGSTQEVMRIDASSNIGIGTNSYTARLFISGSSTSSTPTMIVREGVASPTGGAGVFNVQNSAGTSILFVSGSGNIGIGVTTPDSYQKLTVWGGNIHIQSTASAPGVGARLILADSNYSSFVQSVMKGVSSELALGTNNVEVVRVDGSGNVGIGTSAMDAKLVVNGNSVFSGSVNPDADATRDIGSTAKRWRNIYAANISGSLTGSNVMAGQVIVAGTGGVLSGTNNFVWDNTNTRVGIGTATPGYALDVVGTGYFRGTTAGDPGVEGAYRLKFADVGGTYNDTGIGIDASNNLWFNTVATTAITFNLGTSLEAMRLSGTGNLLLGTTSNTARLFASGSSTATTPTFVAQEGVPASTTGVYILDTKKSSGTSILVVSGSGKVGIGAQPLYSTLSVFSGSSILPQISAEGTSGAAGVAGYNLKIDTTDLWQVITDNNASNGFYLQYNNTVANRYLAVTTAGNVGIGVTNPSTYKLQVNGSVGVWNGSNGRVTAVPSNSANTGYFEWLNGSATRLGYMGGGSSTNMNITMENSANLLIDGGRVGMGVGSGVSGGAGNAWIEGRLVVGETANSASIFLPYGTAGTYAGFKVVHSSTNIGGAADFTDFRMRPAYASGVGTGADVNVIRFNNTYSRNFPDVILVPSGGYAAVGVVPTPAAQFTVSGSSTSTVPTAVFKAGVPTPSSAILDIQTNTGTSIFTVSGSTTGFVGINSTNPGRALVVSDASSAAGAISPAASTVAWLSRNQSDTGYTSALYDATQHIFKVSGTEYVRIDTSGNTGFGTNAPTAGYKIDSRGSVRVQVADPRIDLSGSYRGYMTQVVDNGSASASYWRLYDLTATANRLLVDSNGNVGIGTTTTSDKLSVGGSMSVTGSVLPGVDNSYALGSSTYRWSNVYAGGHYGNFYPTSGTPGSVLFINSSGAAAQDNANFFWDATNARLGIGTTSPGSRLAVVDVNNTFPATFRGTGGTNMLAVGTTSGATNGVPCINGYTSAFGATTDISIQPNGGNVGIGTASPSFRLQLGNNTSTSTATPETISLGGTYSSAAGSNLKLRLWTDGSNTYGIGVSGAQMDYSVNGSGAHVWYTGATQERMRIDSSGNVGIGTASPGFKLEVNGTFAATTKSFLIPHPSKPGWKLRYGSLESPYHGVRLTGEGEVVNGIATVDLPDYIKDLCKQEGSQVQLTNLGHDATLWVDNVSVDDNKFTVKSRTGWISKVFGKKNSLKFFWTFTAIRKDIEDMVVEFEQ